MGIAELPTFQEYWDARAEHAWLLRAEGLRYDEIASCIGVSKQAAANMVAKFSRRVQAAIFRQRTKHLVTSHTHQWAIVCQRAKLQEEADRWIEAWTTQ